MTDEKWVHAPTFRFLEMDMIQEHIKALLPDGVFLLDVKEDYHQSVVNCVIGRKAGGPGFDDNCF